MIQTTFHTSLKQNSLEYIARKGETANQLREIIDILGKGEIAHHFFLSQLGFQLYISKFHFQFTICHHISLVTFQRSIANQVNNPLTDAVAF